MTEPKLHRSLKTDPVLKTVLNAVNFLQLNVANNLLNNASR